MGIRLYPIMKEGHHEAEIIGGSEADVQLLNELEAQRTKGAISMDGFFETLWENPKYEGARYINSFMLNGWGKFYPLPEQRGEDGYLTYCGDLKDMERVELLFAINGIDFDEVKHLIDGVCWG